MLEEEQCVVDAAVVAGVYEFFLEIERRCVVDASEMDEVEDHWIEVRPRVSRNRYAFDHHSLGGWGHWGRDGACIFASVGLAFRLRDSGRRRAA